MRAVAAGARKKGCGATYWPWFDDSPVASHADRQPFSRDNKMGFQRQAGASQRSTDPQRSSGRRLRGRCPRGEMVFPELRNVASAPVAAFCGLNVCGLENRHILLARYFFRITRNQYVRIGEPVGISAAVSIGNTLGPILAASLMEKRVRIADPFSRVGECVAFSAGVVLMGAISAMIGATAVALELPRGAQIGVEHWLNWMISDVGAVLLLTPLLLLLNGQQRLLSQMRQHFPEFCIAVFITLVMISYLVGDTHSGNTGAAFLILVPLLWLAVRFSLAVAYPIFVGTIGIITAMSLSGYGPFSLNGQVGSQFLFAQMSLGFSISILLLGGAATEQRAAEMALRELNGELENRVHQRTAQLLESQAQSEEAALTTHRWVAKPAPLGGTVLVLRSLRVANDTSFPFC